ncbi:MAG TPA: peptide-methionine (S)-S-oxide reductase MsrA [Candidatus Saccharimonadales bacterium]|nr:peptide-methionine (S)-S-oxide reductase MsrA [Candidatus Saccharimonadales bacterium]
MAKAVATLAGGCFWCLEAAYERVKGVGDVISGYAGGEVANPTYEQVSSGRTRHAEAVQIPFDSEVIGYQEILDIFWAIHNPTTPNRQGADVGSQYRSIIFYQDDQQKKAAEESIKKVAELWPDPIVTELVPAGEFYKAEDYHQDYFRKNPTAAYCQIIINPKLEKLIKEYSEKLKPSAS